MGGGKLQPAFSRNIYFEESDGIKDIREYIKTNWYEKKIYKEDRTTIEEYFDSKGITRVPQFMALIKKTGFIIQRFADKKVG